MAANDNSRVGSNTFQSGMTMTLQASNDGSDTLVVLNDDTQIQHGDSNDSAESAAPDSMAHFTIMDILGKGGMGAVYKAQDRKLERFVAIKMFRTSSDNQQTLLAEAKTISRLNHPNIVIIYDIARGDDNNFIVMEWVDGRPLNYQIPSQGLALKPALHYARQIIAAIDCAHQHKIIHRDIKPQNIMVDFADQVKVLDFGIASLLKEKTTKSQSKESDDSSNPSISQLVGTPQYMAPEQIQGQEVDTRSDLFAFGIVLYEMLTGSKPFLGLNIQQISDAINQGDYQPLAKVKPELPTAIIEIVDKLLQTDPKQRYQSAQHVSETLEAIWQDISQQKNWWQRQHWLTKAAMLLPFAAMTLWGGKQVLFPPTTQELVERQMLESKKIAILPFDNISGDPVLQIFSDGVATMLSTDLAEVGYQQGDGSTWVLPASEMRRMDEPTIEKVYNKYGVDLILTGSIQHMGSTRAVNLSLVNASDGRQLKSVNLSIDAKKLFEAQTDIRQQVMELLDWQLPQQLAEQFAAQKPAFDGAYKHYLEGQGYLYRFDQAGNTDRAIESFNKAIEIDPNYADAYVGLAESQLRQYVDTKDGVWLERMETTCDKLVLISPNHIKMDYLNGELFRQRGKYGKAIVYFEKSIMNKPNFLQAYIALSNVYISLKAFNKSEEVLKQAYQLFPNNNLLINSLGIHFFRQSNYEEASRYFSILATQAPNNHWAYTNISASLYLSGDINGAIIAAEKSLVLHPSADGYSNLGTFYFIQRRYAESVAAYEKMIELNDKDYINWGNLADAYRFLGDSRHQKAYKKAIELSERDLRINPNNLSPVPSLAYYWSNLGNKIKALSYAKKIIKESTGRDHFIVATAYTRLGMKKEAIEHLKNALNNNYSKSEIQNSQLLSDLKREPEFQSLVSD